MIEQAAVEAEYINIYIYIYGLIFSVVILNYKSFFNSAEFVLIKLV